ncbi:enoyl-CoA hydratase [Burkholderia pseudomallei]|nr:enoyl-CoA hydratase [Burkholderia pseudomallei]APG01344.1 enoyl-CoA hydratase [Burkholderia pseudomallei]KEO66635.1 enoyl-CoA hydratase [Burkholderia pseudomallei MSHR5855]
MARVTSSPAARIAVAARRRPSPRFPTFATFATFAAARGASRDEARRATRAPNRTRYRFPDS